MEIADYIVADDRQLVARVLEGDDVAFEYLFNRYRDAIYRLFVQRLGGVNDADDLLQETFIKVFLNLDKYDTAFTFGQWIYTIARNTFIDFVRRRRDNLFVDAAPTGAASGLNSVSQEATPEERFIDRQRGAQLEQHLAKMSPRYRQLIELRFFREYSYEEIAAELGMPLGTVKTQIHRARAQLCALITASDML